MLMFDGREITCRMLEANQNKKDEMAGDGRDVLVVDACTYGRAGLTAALQQRLAQRGLKGEVQSCDVLPGLGFGRRPSVVWQALVLRLSPRPRNALIQLLQLRHILAGYDHLVVLSCIDERVVRRVLQSLGVRGAAVLKDARLPTAELCDAIVPGVDTPAAPEGQESWPLMPARVLARAECRVLVQTLREVPVPAQARLADVSSKTVYTQRASALTKLNVRDVLTLIRQFMPCRRPAATL
ncbi:hypothetical protein [Serratia marcescens]|uniref:hypothetical protein n=1 Tax=Serratia marcescens TaxID=615 RepID=UPI003F83E019